MKQIQFRLLTVTQYGTCQLKWKSVLSGIITLSQKMSFAPLGILSPLLLSAKTLYVLYYMLYICAIMQTAEHCYKIFKRRLGDIRVKKLPDHIRSNEKT